MIISIANQKGGVGKSTSSINIAAGLAKKGFKTLLIDIDPQGHSTIGLGINTEDIPTMAELLTEDQYTYDNFVAETYIENLHIIPADLNLSVAEMRLQSHNARSFRLHQKLKGNKYDYVIIDCPPTFGLFATNAFVASDYILMPIALEYFGGTGTASFFQALSYINKEISSVINKEIKIIGSFLTKYNTQTNISREIYEMLDEALDDLFETVIPQNVKLHEAQAEGKSIFDYDPECPGAIAYNNLIDELLKKLEDKNDRKNAKPKYKVTTKQREVELAK